MGPRPGVTWDEAGAAGLPGDQLTVQLPLTVRQRGGRKLVLTPGSTMYRGNSGADSTLVKALARAFRWRRMMETGRFATLNELAAAEKINSSYVSRLLRLTLLAPDIVAAILDGRQPEGMTLPGLMEFFPVDWGRQRCRQPLPSQPPRNRPAPSIDVRDARPS